MRFGRYVIPSFGEFLTMVFPDIRRPRAADYRDVCHCDFGLYCFRHPEVFLGNVISEDELLRRDDWEAQSNVTPLHTRCPHGRTFDEWCAPCDDVTPLRAG